MAAMGFAGCGHVEDIPPGYIGRVLSPSGWDGGIREAGQAEIGATSTDGSCNRLVTCEATSYTVKEEFAKSSDPKKSEDHRIITKSRVPLAVDIYIQVMLPDDKKMRDSIFAQVTPVPLPGKDRVSTITLQAVYDQFAQMTIRGKAREIFAKYRDYDEVMGNYNRINKEVAAMIISTFERNKVPLKLIGGQLSNVKVDESLWAAENRKASADAEVVAIEKVGRAIRANPGYLEYKKWETVKDLTGKDVTVIINDGGGGTNYTIPRK
jgi:hypothetical protein